VNHRTYGATRNCKGCRYWSEMLAQSFGNGVQAMCLAPDGVASGKYMNAGATCDSWKSGHHGAVDDPPNYGEETRALYQKEERAAERKEARRLAKTLREETT
jgi:hypothetical protein